MSNVQKDPLASRSFRRAAVPFRAFAILGVVFSLAPSVRAETSSIPDPSTEAIPGKMCGRYEVILRGDEQRDSGTGLVIDRRTKLVWTRQVYYRESRLTWARATEYCEERGMRLPTKSEALAIAGTNYCKTAWPFPWYTWTSTRSKPSEAWTVGHTGVGGAMRVGASAQVLCVMK